MAEPIKHSPRFTQSAPYAAFLETLTVESEGSPSDDNPMVLVCTECGDSLCDVEDSDTLGVLVRTALAHDEECSARDEAVPAVDPLEAKLYKEAAKGVWNNDV